MRTMARVGFFQETGKDKYVATPMAGVMVTGSPLQDAVLHLYVSTSPFDSSLCHVSEKETN